jgi:hypothetical protein
VWIGLVGDYFNYAHSISGKSVATKPGLLVVPKEIIFGKTPQVNKNR